MGATAHGILSGTDTSAAWAWWSYVVASVAVVFLTVYRIVVAVEARRDRTTTPSPAPAGRLSPLDLRAPGR